AVPFEHIFWSGRESMSMQWNQIGHKLMEALQILKFSSRQGGGLKFTAGTSRSVQLKEMEMYADEQVKVPEDLSTVEIQPWVCHVSQMRKKLLADVIQ
ncbi:hypothetical protein PAXRUDRAFT_152606, partial [Paxillus rubicundulus Ve08.2h10]